MILADLYRKVKRKKRARLTVSKPLPLKILSVVATTFPPFRCKSHIILRLDTCGNICCIRSTSASLARTLFVVAAARVAEFEDEKKKYRIPTTPRTSIRSSCGILIVWSAIMVFLSVQRVRVGIEVIGTERRNPMSGLLEMSPLAER
jgi:hypothetical protein